MHISDNISSTLIRLIWLIKYLRPPTTAEVKSIASRVPRHLHQDWHSIKKSVMKESMHIKVDYCALFCLSRLDSASRRIVEAVQDYLYLAPLVYLRTSIQQPNHCSSLQGMNLVVYSSLCALTS